jgi:hypothetical protein
VRVAAVNFLRAEACALDNAQMIGARCGMRRRSTHGSFLEIAVARAALELRAWPVAALETRRFDRWRGWQHFIASYGMIACNCRGRLPRRIARRQAVWTWWHRMGGEERIARRHRLEVFVASSCRGVARSSSRAGRTRSGQRCVVRGVPSREGHGCFCCGRCEDSLGRRSPRRSPSSTRRMHGRASPRIERIERTNAERSRRSSRGGNPFVAAP